MTLSATNLGKRFNREWIFRRFSFTFEPGVYAITGPNGSGKSTLLQTLWGQTPPSEGTVTFHTDNTAIQGEDIFRYITISAPYMDLIEELTLDEAIQFHFTRKTLKNGYSVDQMAEVFELSHARDKMISQFSSGMKQRLKLGLALFTTSPLIFLDEPCTNLDKKAIGWYQAQLAKRDEKSLVLIASNHENEYPENARQIQLIDYK